mmetsp:Transcript_34335/g.67626  ORF Transcript_34335/g.67626 Transcript_34335/m.67626 type:complete len:213 (-) Transcript_34335:285-923(-)
MNIWGLEEVMAQWTTDFLAGTMERASSDDIRDGELVIAALAGADCQSVKVLHCGVVLENLPQFIKPDVRRPLWRPIADGVAGAGGRHELLHLFLQLFAFIFCYCVLVLHVVGQMPIEWFCHFVEFPPEHQVGGDEDTRYINQCQRQREATHHEVVVPLLRCEQHLVSHKLRDAPKQRVCPQHSTVHSRRQQGSTDCHPNKAADSPSFGLYLP